MPRCPRSRKIIYRGDRWNTNGTYARAQAGAACSTGDDPPAARLDAAAGLCGPAAASCEGHVRPENDDRADDRGDPAAGRESPGAVRLRVPAEEGVADQTAHERADHSQNGRGQPAHVLPAWIDRAREQADDQAENDETDDVHVFVSPLIV